MTELSRPPAEQPPALADAGGVVLTPLTHEPLRVLCVDDNEDAAESLDTLLRMTGFVTRMCHDAGAAIEAAAAFRPEACVLDITMPGMDGYELARRLRAGEKGRDLYLVAVTALGDSASRRRAAEAGFDLHLTKPVPPQKLLDVLFAYERRARGGAGKDD